jgi:hypothetical protein
MFSLICVNEAMVWVEMEWLPAAGRLHRFSAAPDRLRAKFDVPEK